jgi:hypothetical protein
VEHKLRAYAWNVVHRYTVPLVIEACALEADGRRRRARFDSRCALEREDLPDTLRHDLRFTEANLAQLGALLADVDLLHIESVFADADRKLARQRNHLTARQAGTIARRLRARRLVPFHFSPRYQGMEDALRAEVAAAWQGELEADVPV